MKIKSPLAIIGIGLRLPGDIRGPHNFWQALKEGRDCITDVPPDRWNIKKYYDPNPQKSGKIKSKKGGFINGLKEFDADFFGIYPNVAKSLDPRQRHLLEVVYESFEDANLTIDDLYGSETATMIGVFLGDEGKKNGGIDIKNITPHTAMGIADTSVPARIAYQFNLTGPTFAVDTACSSSLVAIHLACNALWSGEAKMAIAGGVNLIASHEHNIALSKGGFLSPDGYCKSFDSSANGYVRGEGAAVVIIKPLKQAISDGDNIYALIRNSIVNSDGYTEEGLTVPNEFSQIRMLERVYGDIDINPADVGFIEAHGTGTVIGDPKECFAFGRVFSEGRNSEKPLIIGSVKTNIGHTEAVAGVAGLIKLALSIKNKKIPPNLHFKNPNPKINFQDWKLKVPTSVTDWPLSESIIGGVNSFGAGGTNAHVILQEFAPDKWNYKNKQDNPQKTPEKTNADPLFESINIFCLSAKNKSALKSLAQKYINFIESDEEIGNLQNVLYTLLKKRSNLPEKLLITCELKDEKQARKHLVSALKSYIEDKNHEGLVFGSSANSNLTKIAFVCSGQGPQWYAMGRQLIEHSKVFKEVIEKIDKIFQNLSGVSLLAEMNKNAEESRISETRIAQPAIMAIQIGLIHLWQSLGIKPQGIVGHSIGEVAAAYCAESLTLEQAVEVIYNRSKEQDKASGAGKMLAIGVNYEKAKQLIIFNKVSDVVSIAAINGPEMIVLSGEEKSLEEIAQQLTKDEIFNKFLVVNVPFHSHYMNVVKDGMIKDLKHIKAKQSKIALYSTVTGKQEDGHHLTNEYWYKNVRDTVFFADAIKEMINDGFSHFVEIAPHPVLSSGVLDILKFGNSKNEVHENQAIPCLSRNIKLFEEGILYEPQNFLNAVSKLWIELKKESLSKIEFSCLFNSKVSAIKLPSYAWQHQEYWSESKEHQESRIGKPSHPFIKSCTKSIANHGLAIWELNLDKNVETYLEDHKVDEVIVFPGAGQLEIAHEIGQETYQKNFLYLCNVTFNRALFLSEDENQVQARLEIINHKGDYKIYSRLTDNDPWQLNGSGTMVHEKNHGQIYVNLLEDKSLSGLKERINKGEKTNVESFYNDLKKQGLNYGPNFRLIKEIWQKDNEILSKIELNEESFYSADFYNIIPNLFDASLHPILSISKHQIYLPHSCESYKLYSKPAKVVWSYIKIVSHDRQFVCGDFLCFGEGGELIYECRKIKLKLLESASMIDDLYRGIYEHKWKLLDSLSKISEVNQKKENILLFASDTNLLSDELIKQGNNLIKVKLLTKESTESGFKKVINDYEINAFCRDDFIKLFEDFSSRNFEIEKIVNLITTESRISDNSSCEELSLKSKAIIEPSLYLLQEIAKLNYSLKIFFVTSGADIVNKEDKAANFIQGLCYGMTRVFINEYPQHSFKTIDIGNPKNTRDELNLCDEICFSDQEKHIEIAIRNGQRYARQLIKVSKKKQNYEENTQLTGTYLITGGTSGLGLTLAQWLFKKGVRNFALVSRSGPKYPSDLQAIKTLEKQGAKVIWQEVKGDMTKESDVDRVIDYINRNMPSLKGIIHSAGLLEDATYPNMTSDKFMKIYNPKALGAWNLHKATLKNDLETFLLISSVSSIIGIAGQNNYSSANNFLNYLAMHRKASGLVASSACYGLLSGDFAGMSKVKSEMVNFIERSVGTITIDQNQLLAKTDIILESSDYSYLMISPMNWKNYATSYQAANENFTLKELLSKENSEDTKNKSGMRNELILIDRNLATDKVLSYLKSSLSSILGISESSVQIDISINKIGLDSLMLNQFRNWIQNHLEINFSLIKLAKGPSIKDLAIDIAQSIINSGNNAFSLTDDIEDISGISNSNEIEVTSEGWIIKLKSSGAKITNRIFCLHPVGAGASMFSYFMFNPPTNSEIFALQLPGRENRSKESFYTNMHDLIPNMAEAILPFLDLNIIFWGHSWGGIALFEIIKYLRINRPEKIKNISNLIVSASIAPQLTKPWKKRDSIKEAANKSSTAEKIISTISYIDDEGFLRKIIPVMQKDMEMIMTYKYESEEKLDIPITAFGAIEDDVVLIDEIKQWKDQTSKEFTLHQVHGDHWFLSRNKEFINQKIAEITNNYLK